MCDEDPTICDEDPYIWIEMAAVVPCLSGRL